MTVAQFDAIAEGDVLPELDVPLTATVIVAGAIASRDFYPGHHDKDVAIGLGMKHVFMNILTTSGWLGRYVTDWAGPDAVLERYRVRLGVPNYPGDTMRLRGRVTAVRADDRAVDVEVVASNDLGDHARATLGVAFPEAR